MHLSLPLAARIKGRILVLKISNLSARLSPTFRLPANLLNFFIILQLRHAHKIVLRRAARNAMINSMKV